jgi:hypothetical protein
MLSRGLERAPWSQLEPCLQQSEVGPAVGVANDDLAIEHGVDGQTEARLCELRKGASQVIAVSAKQLHAGLRVVQQPTEPIEFRLVAPARSARQRLFLTGRASAMGWQ